MARVKRKHGKTALNLYGVLGGKVSVANRKRVLQNKFSVQFAFP